MYHLMSHRIPHICTIHYSLVHYISCCERKVYIFGVCCEGIPRQINYLIDEAMYIGKGANVVVNLLHHYLANYSLGEKHLHLHADNCVGQNKNNTLIRVSL